MITQERALKIAAAFCALALLLSGIYVFKARPGQSLPDFGEIPPFALLAQDGSRFDSASLRGKVWVASFVYSTCKTSCPMLGAQMKRLYDAMPEHKNFQLISITVDPDRDSPQALARYAKDLGVQDSRWVFLTGKKAYIRNLITKGFKLPAEPGVIAGDNDILHSSKLVLVDGTGRARGYFDGTLGEAAAQIMDAAGRLLKEAHRG